MTDFEEVMLTAKQVQTRYGGISAMTLHRWSNDARLNFPAPFRINSVRYWKLSEITSWERSRAGKVAA